MVNRNKKVMFFIIVIFFFVMALIGKVSKFRSVPNDPLPPLKLWSIESIDNMKYSRDLARQMLNNPKFDETIDKQVSLIAGTGATHIALGVPYDDEFLPIMKRWVDSARSHNLKVWFRGNLSGWEGWFDYPSINRSEHIKKIKSFIESNGNLFEDGDLFSSCPECENGREGDPRKTGDVQGYRDFLIEETATVRLAFRQIDKNITANLNSMNGDVARLIMDQNTTAQLGGFVVIDHYVSTPEKLLSDIRELAKNSGGKIILGEFGAPIPDVHGNLNEDGQNAWIAKALKLLASEKSVYGINYWTGFGGSTQLWNDDNSPRKVVDTIYNNFNPQQITGVVKTYLNLPVDGAQIVCGDLDVSSDHFGRFTIPSACSQNAKLTVNKEGYVSKGVSFADTKEIVLKPDNYLDWFFSLISW